MNMQIDLEKGIANVGDVSRIREVMARAKRGGRLVIGFIGGSITQGSLSAGGVCLLQCWNRRHDIGVRRGACGDGSSGGETGLCDCGIFRQ